jgi:molybdopterin-guanine dinucleotide biosynthesis protein A
MHVESAQVLPGVSGIVLAGGRSRRMGRNKALLPAPDASSLTFVERLASLLAEICTEILLVARDETSGKEYSSLSGSQNWRIVYDQVANQGPLMGLYSGLQATTFSHALVLAVDLPFVQPALLSWLSAFPLTDKMLVPRVHGTPQVLLARYPRSLLPAIEQCLRAGRRDPRALLEQVVPRFLEEEQARAIDPDLRSFVNINTPEDFARELAAGL